MKRNLLSGNTNSLGCKNPFYNIIEILGNVVEGYAEDHGGEETPTRRAQ